MTNPGTWPSRPRCASRARVTLRQSNVRVATRLVRRGYGSYARALPYVKVLERGGEGPSQEHGPNNYINYINKKNWAALVRPIFLDRHFGHARG